VTQPAQTAAGRLHDILTDLAYHPDSSAREIADRLGLNSRNVFQLLNNAAFSGACQCWREGNGPWRWEIPGTGEVIGHAGVMDLTKDDTEGRRP
jgi:hypothetical protein